MNSADVGEIREQSSVMAKLVSKRPTFAFVMLDAATLLALLGMRQKWLLLLLVLHLDDEESRRLDSRSVC